MNNLAEICFVGVGVRENYGRCIVIFVIFVQLGGAKRCGGDFKAIILREGGGRGKPQRGDQFLWR